MPEPNEPPSVVLPFAPVSDEAGPQRYAFQESRITVGGREWRMMNTQFVLTIEEEDRYFLALANELPYGVVLWPAGIALAHELCDRADELRGKTVLELGAGVGLPGIVARYLGAEVMQTELFEMAMYVCKLNAQFNQVEGIQYATADWTDFQDTAQYDYIIGSDILYDPKLHPYLLRIFQNNLKPGGHVLITDPWRKNSTEFLIALTGQGWLIRSSEWRIALDEGERVYGIVDLQYVGEEAMEAEEGADTREAIAS